jgi:hypothetical protein
LSPTSEDNPKVTVHDLRELVLGEEIQQMRGGKVEVGLVVGAAGQVEAQRARPGVAEPLDGQAADLGAGAVPDLLPHAVVDGAHGGLGPGAVVGRAAAVALGPGAAPQAHVGLGAERPLLGRAPVVRRDGVDDAVRVVDGHGARRRAPVERVRPRVQRGRHGRKRRDQPRRVGPARQQRREPAAVGLAARVDAAAVHVVRLGDGLDHVVDVGNLSRD